MGGSHLETIKSLDGLSNIKSLKGLTPQNYKNLSDFYQIRKKVKNSEECAVAKYETIKPVKWNITWQSVK